MKHITIIDAGRKLGIAAQKGAAWYGVSNRGITIRAGSLAGLIRIMRAC